MKPPGPIVYGMTMGLANSFRQRPMVLPTLEIQGLPSGVRGSCLQRPVGSGQVDMPSKCTLLEIPSYPKDGYWLVVKLSAQHCKPQIRIASIMSSGWLLMNGNSMGDLRSELGSVLSQRSR